MISVLCQIDGTNALVARNSLFHSEQVDSIPLTARWRQEGNQGADVLDHWNVIFLASDETHVVIEPPDKTKALEVQYSEDGKVWNECQFLKLTHRRPKLRCRMVNCEKKMDDLLLVFSTAYGPVSLAHTGLLPLEPGYEFTAEFSIEPELTWFLHPEIVGEIQDGRYDDVIRIEVIEPPRYHYFPCENRLMAGQSPAKIAMITKQAARYDG